ncbi:armadillo-type protein [Gamsiella multidivaricata]|uniref:armadillo-type protein n=1 Tax=Gamsiella multidivaricata TaxID=101098 RepID=UPI00221F330C|nr:armadillo-type protein [Gamsiella multidivaricata]KAI7822876.1 armadillo-type protein [Gamsiella multidivaricata]
MDESVLRNLLAALETIYNATSTNEARQQAQEYCEGLKRDASAPLYGYYLAHKDNQQPDVVRHFGLGLIENVVRYRWSDGTLTPETKAQIRDNVMSLAAEGSKPLLTEQSFIKEKVARLFVEVAKREWPGVWENMDAFLRQLFFKDETGREMALLILRSLCEDVFVYDDAVAGLRKKDLRAGLLVIMSSEGVLKEHYPDGVKGHRDEVTLMLGESGNDGWIARLAVLLQELLPRCQSETRAPADEKIAIAALKTFSSGLDWVIVSSVSSAPVVPFVCQSLLSPSEKIRLAGAECYDVLSCRNLSDAEREKIIWPLLEEGGVDIISRAYLAYATQILQGEAYKFIQKTVQATVNLGEQQLCAKRSAYVPKELSKFLQLLYSMASHPSMLISSIVSFFWATLLRHETFSKDPTVHSFIPPLLELYSKHLARDFKIRWETDLVYRHFASIDFDSVTEFRGYAEKTFARAVDVIHRGVPVVPLDAFIWVGNKVTQALQTEFPQATDVRETSQYHQFDGTLTLMEITISSLKDLIADSSHAQAGQVLDAVNSLLGILIEYDNKCLPAVERCVATFSAFTDLFKLNSTLLFRSLDKLFKTVEHPMSDLTMRDARQLRLRAATTLAKIGKAIPNTLYPIYGQIEIAIQGLIQRNAITHGEKRTLQLFLLVIGFNSNMPLDRKTIFENIVQPVVLDLHSPDVQEALSDPKKFMAFIGVSELSNASITTPLPEQIDALKRIITQRRCKLSGAIESLHAFMKETIDVNDDQRLMLWTSRIDSILPGLFSTIRCLSAICDERLWADFSPDVSRALSLSAEEKEMMVTGKAPSAAAGSAPTGTVARLIFDLKNWLSSLRDQSYRVLAQISQLGPAFYSISSLQTILEQSLFGHVDYLTDRQLRLLINHAIQPLVLNCPESSMDSVLSHLLTVLFPYLDQRLLKDWKLASDEGLVMDEKDDPEELDITDGIVREVMLRDLTFYIAGFIFSILDYAKKAPVNAVTAQNQGAVGAAGHKEIAPLALFILSRDTIVQSIIPLMCHIMTFKDTKSCLRSTEAALCVLTVLVQNYPGSKNIIGSFSTTVLQSAMEALHDPYHQEGHDKLIRLITEVYVEVRAFDEAPKLVFQQTLGADTQRLEAFERDLSAATNKTEKHALVRNFLQGIIGVSKGHVVARTLVSLSLLSVSNTVLGS